MQIGKPELLRHELSRAWSHGITDEHRLVYLIVNNEIRVIVAAIAINQFGCETAFGNAPARTSQEPALFVILKTI